MLQIQIIEPSPLSLPAGGVLPPVSGFYRIHHAAYHADPAPEPSLTRGTICNLVQRSPLHAWHQHPRLGQGNGKTATEEMDFGSLVHELMLGQGGGFVVIEHDNFLTKDAKAQRDAARAEGKTPVLGKTLRRATAAADAIREQLDATGCADAFQTAWTDDPDIPFICHNELMAMWQEHGEELTDVPVWCRTLMDGISVSSSAGEVTIYDLKTTTDAAPDVVSRRIYDGLHIQAAWYTRGVETLLPEAAGRVRFVFVYAETQEPFAVSLVELNEAGMTLGRAHVEKGLRLWREYLGTHGAETPWPGFGPHVHTAEVPPWKLKEMMEEEAEG